MSSMPDRLAALERRLSRLEANPAASLRFGSVTGVEGGFVRVQLPDGQNMVSAPLPTVQPRVLKDQDIKMPDIGEPVAVLFAGQGLEAGVILGACYSPVTPDPAKPPHMDYRRYEDGTEIFYDRKAHKLTARVKGDADIETEGQISARAKKDIRAESSTFITLKAPIIHLNGLLRVTDKDGQPGSGELSGNYRITNGSLAVPQGDVTAGKVSLREHGHDNVMNGPSVSGDPVGGGESVSSDPNNSAVYEEYFNALYETPPQDATDKDKLLLCLPEIAAEEAIHAYDSDDTQGWEYLQGMFLRWFSGPGNKDSKKNPIPYWVDWDWVMQFARARKARDELVGLVLSEKARPQLAEILIKEGKMGKEETTFFFSRAHWLDWERLYHQRQQVGLAPHVDGLMVALRRFTLKALCSGIVVPLSDGRHRICVTEIALYVYDEFKFTEKGEFLGSWNCAEKKFTTGQSSNWVWNEDFTAFRERHGLGNDFVVLSQPKIIDDFKAECYVYP